jgi:hypothetical protein
MKYEIKQKENRQYYVFDENGTQYGNGSPNARMAQFLIDTLIKEESQPQVEPWIFGSDILSNDDPRGIYAAPPREEKVIPVEENRDYVTIPEKNEVGAIIDYRGESWLVTQAYEVTGYEYTHEEDEAPEPGFYSQLFRVRDNHQAMQVVAEQARTGHAHFTGPFTVKFADEPLPLDMRKLAYSPQSGLSCKPQS